MFRSILVAILMLASLAGVAQPPPPLPKPPVPAVQADGRLEVPSTGFSIIPPPNWEILRNSHGSSLLFRGPKDSGKISYQATLQIMVFQDYRYIDNVTQQEFGKLIVEKFSNLSNRVQNYRMRSEEKIKLENGTEAILYYTEFAYDDIPIMQMHILVSSASHHILMTYTDLAKVFEEENSPGLTIAYTSMQSAVLSSQPPSRYYFMIVAGSCLLALLVFWGGFRLYRSNQMKRLGAKMEEEDSRDIHSDEEAEYYSRHTHLSDVQPLSRADDSPNAVKKSRPSSRRAAAQEDEDDDFLSVKPVNKSSSSLGASKPKTSLPPSRLASAISQVQPEIDDRQTKMASAAIDLNELDDNEPDLSLDSDDEQESPAQFRTTPSVQETAPRLTVPPQPASTPSEAPSNPRLTVPPQLPLQASGNTDSPRMTVPPQAPLPPQLPLRPMSGEAPIAARTTIPPQAASFDLRTEKPSRNTQAPLAHDLELNLEKGYPQSEVARLSEILPQDGSSDDKKSKKKRAMFWKKSKDEDLEEPVSEAWEEPKPSSKKGKKTKKAEALEDATVSQVWEIDSANAEESQRADEADAWVMGTEDATPASEVAELPEKAKGKKKVKGQAKPGKPSQSIDEAEEEADPWNLAKSESSPSADEDEDVS